MLVMIPLRCQKLLGPPQDVEHFIRCQVWLLPEELVELATERIVLGLGIELILTYDRVELIQ